MNYIAKLQGQVEDRDEAIATGQERIQRLLEYLHSPKFHNDTTVQVREIVAELTALRLELQA